MSKRLEKIRASLDEILKTYEQGSAKAWVDVDILNHTSYLISRVEELEAIGKRVLKMAFGPGQIDPFHDDWKWYYELEDVIAEEDE